MAIAIDVEADKEAVPHSSWFIARLKVAKGIFLFCLAMLLSAAWLLVSCDRAPKEDESAGVLRLDRLEPLPAYQGENQRDIFRIAIAAVLSPADNESYYRPLIDYFAKALGRPARLMQRRNYQEMNDLLARGGVDLAFVCTGAYLRGREYMELLVVPRIKGKTTYCSLLIAHASSPVGAFEQLRGKIFAFTDPLSLTGYFYPMGLLKQMGEQPESFFAKTIFTYSHDRSIYAVARGLVDGAAVDHLVYEQLLAQDPKLGTRIWVLQKSEEYGIPPVVVPATAPPEQKLKLRELFLHMHENEEGVKILRGLGIDRFIEADPASYR